LLRRSTLFATSSIITIILCAFAIAFANAESRLQRANAAPSRGIFLVDRLIRIPDI